MTLGTILPIGLLVLLVTALAWAFERSRERADLLTLERDGLVRSLRASRQTSRDLALELYAQTKKPDREPSVWASVRIEAALAEARGEDEE